MKSSLKLIRHLWTLPKLSMNASLEMNSAHCTSPIGYDLWQRNSNGISHIDSDETDTKSSAEDTSQHQRYQQEPFISSVLLYNHPSSNYAYKNGQERKPVWQYWNKTLFFHMVIQWFSLEE